MDGSLFSLPLFLTDEVEGAPSLTTIVPQSSDSDEITCVGYGACTLDACPKYCYDVGCPRDCSDCSDCSDSPTYTAPTFTITNITETGADINVSPGTGYTRYRVFARLTSDPDDVSYDWTFSKTIAFTAVMGSLEPKTKYTVNVCGVIGNTSDKWAGAKTFTTGGKSRPADWSWWSAGAAGKPISISADEWKAFYDRIDAFRVYAGQGAWGLYKPVSKGTVISAAIVNEVRAAIGPITTAARPKYINPGDPITADYFNSLKDFLNSVP